jgi:hypothetical protein
LACAHAERPRCISRSKAAAIDKGPTKAALAMRADVATGGAILSISGCFGDPSSTAFLSGGATTPILL